MPFKQGHVLADYVVDAVLGGGGMGDVYKVTNRLTGQGDAAKVLKPELTSDPAQLARFLQEIRTLAQLKHENIVALRTALTAGDQLVMVIEYVDGDSLDKVRGNLRKLDGIVSIATQLLSAFHFAHEKGIIHRDIKPQNIMVTKNGHAKVLDFGIAKIVQERGITPTGYMLGSPHYMSPEQITGHDLDARTDIYSLGVVLYEMVTQKLPFDGNGLYSIWEEHLKKTPNAPSDLAVIPLWLNNLILRALAKSREDRFGSAQEMLDALKEGTAGKRAPGATQFDMTPIAPETLNSAGDREQLEELTSMLNNVEQRVAKLATDAPQTKELIDELKKTREIEAAQHARVCQQLEELTDRLDRAEKRILEPTRNAPQPKPKPVKNSEIPGKASQDNGRPEEPGLAPKGIVAWSAWITLALLVVAGLSWFAK